MAKCKSCHWFGNPDKGKCRYNIGLRYNDPRCSIGKDTQKLVNKIKRLEKQVKELINTCDRCDYFDTKEQEMVVKYFGDAWGHRWPGKSDEWAGKFYSMNDAILACEKANDKKD